MGATHLGDKKVWRWQVRSHPPFAGTERQDLMTHRLPVQRHLPPATLSMLSQVVVAVLGQSNPGSEAAARRRALLFVLLKVIWPSAAVSPDGQRPRGRQRQRRIAQRTHRALSGDWLALCEQSKAWAVAQTQGSEEEAEDPDKEAEACPVLASQAQQILRDVMRGSQSAALSKIDAPPLAAVTRANWNTAWDKLNPNVPQAYPPCDPAVPVWSPPAANWNHAITHLRDGKAVDPGGWSHEVLKTLWANPIASVPLQDWLDKMMWHLSPDELTLLHAHRLVMLSKTPSGEGVRPILISTLWRKIATAAVTHFIKPMIVPKLQGKQCGIAAKGGAASLHAFTQNTGSCSWISQMPSVPCRDRRCLRPHQPFWAMRWLCRGSTVFCYNLLMWRCPYKRLARERRPCDQRPAALRKVTILRDSEQCHGLSYPGLPSSGLWSLC